MNGKDHLWVVYRLLIQFPKVSVENYLPFGKVDKPVVLVKAKDVAVKGLDLV